MLPCGQGDHTSCSGQALSPCCPGIVSSSNIPFPSLPKLPWFPWQVIWSPFRGCWSEKGQPFCTAAPVQTNESKVHFHFPDSSDVLTLRGDKWPRGCSSGDVLQEALLVLLLRRHALSVQFAHLCPAEPPIKKKCIGFAPETKVYLEFISKKH